MKVWPGKDLAIDLSRGSVEAQPLDPEMARLYLGGRGLGARLLMIDVRATSLIPEKFETAPGPRQSGKG